MVRFSPNGQMILTGSWTGNAKLWDVPNLNLKATLRGHADRVGGVDWHPMATIGQSEQAVNFATGAADHMVKLWSLGRWVILCVFLTREKAWLCWSANEMAIHGPSPLSSDRSIATLQGHTGRVCRVNFHPSGNYLGSASYDGTWRLWDVEKQKELLIQEGHSREVFALAFQDDGALVASG